MYKIPDIEFVVKRKTILAELLFYFQTKKIEKIKLPLHSQSKALKKI